MEEAATIETRSVYSGRVVNLAVDRVRLPNGRIAEMEVIRHPGATAIVPLTDDGQVLLVRQYRYAPRRWLLEVPAGKLDPGEPPAVCAKRELQEEVGYLAGELIPLGQIWTTPGFTDEAIWLYLATGLEAGRQNLQVDEVLSVESHPFPEVLEMVHSGEICDSKSVCALLRAEAYLRAR
jgi:ADP-ribose pyrophosphatase